MYQTLWQGTLKFAKYLYTCGEAETVKSKKYGKLGDRGITIMMVGYMHNHEGDVHWMLNVETGRITEIHENIWLVCKYYECENSIMAKIPPAVSLQVPQTVGYDDKGDEKIVNEAVPQLKSEERDDDDSYSTGTKSSSSQASNDGKWVKHTTRSGH